MLFGLTRVLLAWFLTVAAGPLVAQRTSAPSLLTEPPPHSSVVLAGAALVSAPESGAPISFFSASKRLRFVLTNPDGEEAIAFGSLFEHDPHTEEWIPVWPKQPAALPNKYRPRFVEVMDSGKVVTFDDWLNEPSERAIVVYGRDGKVLSQHGLYQVARALRVSPADMTKYTIDTPCGIWLQAAPKGLGADRIQLRTAGRFVSFDAASGALSLVRSSPGRQPPQR